MDSSLKDPQENILCDEALFRLAEQGGAGEILRFWESPSAFIVLGRSGSYEKDCLGPAVRKDRIPVLRRCSGGGTVLQGPGCLNFTLVLSKERDRQLDDIRKSYSWILARVIDVLARQNISAVFKPISDLAVESVGREALKFSGNAQRRGRKFILHHGTILYDFDLSLIERYLQLPQERPEYRRDRRHLDFVRNIALDRTVFFEDMRNIFQLSVYIPMEFPLMNRMIYDLADRDAGTVDISA